jgi:uncharacterized sporulation protein YeaH/YhbH (DUF444 family)
MSPLRTTIHELAQAFADSLLDAIRRAPVGEISGPERPAARPRAGRTTASAKAKAVPASIAKPSTSRRPKRRSPKDIAGALAQVVAVVKKSKGGMRAEQIRSALGMLPKEMPRVLHEGLAKKALRKKGQKRATTYFA